MQLKINFTKMHGLGNDFIIIEKSEIADIKNFSDFVLFSSPRRTGIGCDQLILFEEIGDNKVQMEIYNADSGKAEACGNATRCLASIFFERKNIDKLDIFVKNRKLSCNKKDGFVSVNMGRVSFEEEWMPEISELTKEISKFLSQNSEFLCVDVGNPHLVIIDSELSDSDMELLGKKLEKSHLFKEGVNVNFAKIEGDVINLRVWERGTGFTYACGSGASASFAACNKLGFMEQEGRVRFKLGELSMKMINNEIEMSGPASLVASGVIYYEN